MKEIVLKIDDDIYDRVLSFLSLLPENKIRIVKKETEYKRYKRYYGILRVKNTEKEIDKEIRKMRDEWEERLSF
ncbi:hypothetical protein GFV12_06885 [Desulfurobacterium thermolithotrophum]|uniref:hypothetical protein n=1 Tax=Desulfurobacterium thermolithotrophum TaxID=64160 RepID=UPI0013D81C2F|nr:hypothetical protein [Desulfurobacterium thermolithotrophum]